MKRYRRLTGREGLFDGNICRDVPVGRLYVLHPIIGAQISAYLPINN